ncbi:MAG: Gfo/Idh/MocA family oxidoreductase [Chloroflexi bacterium]|nr:Gfo/Idh/MocA family oxidoreductase [Chloroflexota bacterium]
MIRFGVVGVGGYGAVWRQVLEPLEERGIARIAAATDGNAALLAALAPTLQARGTRVFASVDALLAEGRAEIDVVGLPVAIASHAPLTVRALDAGYNVLVEKPAAATVQDLLAMQAAERRAQRWCAVDYQYLYSPVTPWVLNKLTDGSLGALREARVRIDWPRAVAYYQRNAWAGRVKVGDAWVLDGPATNAVAHHLAHLIYWGSLGQAGLECIEAVRAELYRAKPIESYDTSYLELRLTNGVRVLHIASHAVQAAHEPEALLLCERGRITWYSSADCVRAQYADGREEQFTPNDGLTLNERTFVQVAELAAGRQPAPVCGLREAGPQVLAVNLAFESSGGVRPIGAKYAYEVAAHDGSSLVAVHGMEEALACAFEQGRSFAEQGLPWAQAGEWVSASDYRRFPRHPRLLALG